MPCPKKLKWRTGKGDEQACIGEKSECINARGSKLTERGKIDTCESAHCKNALLHECE